MSDKRYSNKRYKNSNDYSDNYDRFSSSKNRYSKKPGKKSNEDSGVKRIVKVSAITTATVVLLAVACGVYFFVFSNNEPKDSTEASTTQAVTDPTTQENTTQATENTETTENITTQTTEDVPVTTEHQHTTAESIVVPTIEGETVQESNISATYVPVKAFDNGEQISLREVFGSSYSKGSITFNSDGTFTDTISPNSATSGAYAIEDSKIILTYSNDSNEIITINNWENDIPSDIQVEYLGGYVVYFKCI